mmetsp:Transcript_5230/g.11362  ORF Transcript_5230/g.11362 Transcript_5230/m.11362 type:complete len:247 (-) Transcript_5230:949-1689(-)|eukprot:6180748-Pleurochrysis_carterae.AAC.5
MRASSWHAWAKACGSMFPPAPKFIGEEKGAGCCAAGGACMLWNNCESCSKGMLGGFGVIGCGMGCGRSMAPFWAGIEGSATLEATVLTGLSAVGRLAGRAAWTSLARTFGIPAFERAAGRTALPAPKEALKLGWKVVSWAWGASMAASSAPAALAASPLEARIFCIIWAMAASFFALARCDIRMSSMPGARASESILPRRERLPPAFCADGASAAGASAGGAGSGAADGDAGGTADGAVHWSSCPA